MQSKSCEENVRNLKLWHMDAINIFFKNIFNINNIDWLSVQNETN